MAVKPRALVVEVESYVTYRELDGMLSRLKKRIDKWERSVPVAYRATIRLNYDPQWSEDGIEGGWLSVSYRRPETLKEAKDREESARMQATVERVELEKEERNTLARLKRKYKL